MLDCSQALPHHLRDLEVHHNSPWASSGFIVPKKDGSFRFIVDYKPLNKVTVRDNYPIPRIDDILKYLGTAEWISTFDLSKGFFQIAMR